MFKSILITILLIALICSVFFIVFGKMFVKDLKSKDEIKRSNAEKNERSRVYCFCMFIGTINYNIEDILGEYNGTEV